ncbi:AAA family ATPase [Variovorax paradoxus]|nr:AAA family ATPase [Variovorax paradoxus]
MQCPLCQCENLADASFCQDCGAKLELICSGCHAANAATSRFCRKCGTPLTPKPAVVAAATIESSQAARTGASAEAATVDPYVPAHLAERFRLGHAAHLTKHAGERKIITALFADIKGSMALLDGMDPEVAQQVIDPALRLMMSAVYRYEGYVAQALGDGIFAFFGAPIAREDHARRALYAALSMQEQMKAYGARLLREKGLPAVQIRVGIHTGEVVVRSIPTDDRRADYVPIGHSTGLAARIEHVAAPGSVVVSESTHRLTEGYFEFRSLGSVPLKGVSANVNLFEVAGVGPLHTRLEVSASHGLARFVGRQNELERMQAMLQLAKAGEGQIIGVIGEAGVGKSRLCHEFKLLAKEGCLILECSSDSYGKAFPYLPLIDMLKSYLQIAPADDERRKLEKVTGRVLGLDRSLDDTIPFLLALLGVRDAAAPIDKMDPQIQRRRTFDAIQRLVLREAVNQPVLMVMEDLHWLDAESQSFLTMFGRAVEGARILLLVNYRPEYQPSWDAGTSHSQLRLKAFGREDAEALLIALLGTAPALAELKSLIVMKTQGNPFFLEEYVQTLFDHGVLLRRGEEIVLTRALATIEMPATVQGVLAARIDRLEPEHKAFLQMLAVLGNASPLRLIERVAQSSETQLQDMLDRLQSAEFIFERTVFPDVEYVFKHALTRETAYGELLADTRRILHSRVAQAMEAHFSDHLDDHCSELAHHYACSDNVPKAVDFLMRAGSQAMQRSAYATAIDHLSSSLTMLPGLSDPAGRDSRELQIQSMLGSAWMATRGFAVPEVAQAYERARELCQDTTASADLVRVLSGLGLLYINRGELRLARDIGEQLLGLAERRLETELFVSGHELLGLTLLRVGDLIDCRSHTELAVQRYEDVHDHALRDSLSRDPRVSCLAFGALALWLLGYPDQAVAGVAQAQRAAHAATPRHPFSLGYAMASSAWVHQFRGEASLALQAAEATTDFATEQGFPSWLVHGLIVQGWAEAELGNTESGFTHIEQALLAYKATGAKVWQPLFLLLQVQALSRAGQVAEGLESVTEALGLASEMGTYWWEAELFRVRGELLLALSTENAAEAQTCFERALSIARQQSAKSLELRTCVSMVRLARLHGGHAQALLELASVYEWFTEGFDAADLIEARELLGGAGQG